MAGLVLMAVAAGAGGWWYDKVSANVTFESFDLSNGQPPPSVHVTMTGVAHPEYLVEFGAPSDTWRDRYMPITAASWRRSDPLVYFIRATAGEFAEFSQHFPILAQRDVLIKNDLPGPVAEIDRKRNLGLAPLPVVLDLHSDADAEPYFITAFVAGVFGLGCLFTAATRAIRRGRWPQT